MGRAAGTPQSAPANGVLVAGAGGFIGGHLVSRLRDRGVDRIVAVDIKDPSDWFQRFHDVENLTLDLSLLPNCHRAVQDVDVVYNLACDMGGMGFIENNKALCMLSVLVNTHLLVASRDAAVRQYFYSSSACVYNEAKQDVADVTALTESDAYPAMPEDGYGWEKLFSERMCRHFSEDFGLDVRVARFHNVYGPHGTWQGGREKAPAAISRKVIEAVHTGQNEIEIWGDGTQTRSFTYIDDCLTGIEKIMAAPVDEPINLGSSELVSINDLVSIVEDIAGASLTRRHRLNAPLGVRGRNSDNTLIREHLDWEPNVSLRQGMAATYSWIEKQYLNQS